MISSIPILCQSMSVCVCVCNTNLTILEERRWRQFNLLETTTPTTKTCTSPWQWQENGWKYLHSEEKMMNTSYTILVHIYIHSLIRKQERLNKLLIRPSLSTTFNKTCLHIHTRTYIYIYIYVCMCVCVLAETVRERNCVSFSLSYQGCDIISQIIGEMFSKSCRTHCRFSW